VAELFARIGARWTSELRSAVLERVRAEAPVRSGALRESLTVEVVNPPPFARIAVSSPLPYLPYVIAGTQPHEIWPVHARALHWTGAGGDVFAAHVAHPGTRPNPFPERAARGLQQLAATTALAVAVDETLAAIRRLFGR